MKLQKTIFNSFILCTLLFTFSCENSLNSPLVNSSKNRTNNYQKNENENFALQYAPQTMEGFNEDAYLLAFPDVKSAVNNGVYVNGYQHYLTFGKAEHRLDSKEYKEAFSAVSDGFVEEAYLNAFPDIKSAVENGTFASGYEHYINFVATDSPPRLQRTEYIQAKNVLNLFDEENYLLAFKDVRDSYKAGIIQNSYWHYVVFGRSIDEKRLDDPRYADVKTEIVDNKYNEKAYLLAFPDVAAVIPSVFATGYQHYIEFGKSEGRLSQQKYLDALVAIRDTAPSTSSYISLSQLLQIDLQGKNQAYKLSAEAGKRYLINLAGSTFEDAYLKLYTPDGSLAFMDDDGKFDEVSGDLDDEYHSVIDFVSLVNGDWTIEVSTFASANNDAPPIGFVDLTVQEVVN